MPPVVKFPVPVSMLKARARELEFERLQAMPESERSFHENNLSIAEAIGWQKVIDEFQFPEVYSWEADQAPVELMEQLIGQIIDFGMTIRYKEKDCLVVDLDVRADELGQVMRGNHLDAYWRPITIVPLQYIDLDT